jgi:hypothetical protein
MATAKSVATPRIGNPGNKGNRRSGAVKGTHSGLRRGQLPWRKDPVILERLNLIRTLRAQGYSSAGMMLGPVNELMRRRGVPEITVDAVYDDFPRLKELQREEQAQAAKIEGEAKQEHIDALQEVKRQAWRAFHSASTSSLNRGSYLNTIASTEEKIAKLDGTLTQRVELEASIRNGDRDIDAEIERLLAERVARPRLLVEGPHEVEATG